jgi:hypothetical protein
MIKRFDEILLEKASKFTLTSLQEQIPKLAMKEDVQNMNVMVEEKMHHHTLAINANRDKIAEREHNLKAFAEEVSRRVFINHSKELLERLGGKPLESTEIKMLLSNKAEKLDIFTLENKKANKLDAENSMRTIELIQKQIEHIATIMVELTNQQHEGN